MKRQTMKPMSLFYPIDAVAGGDAVLPEPALFHFQGVPDRQGRSVEILLVHGSHVLDLQDHAVGGDKSDGEREKCVLHPEGEDLLFFKDKKHAAVRRQFFAEHQAGPALLRGFGHFRPDRAVTDR